MQHTGKKKVLRGFTFTLFRVKTSIKSFIQGCSFPAKPFLGNVFIGVLLNLRKSLSQSMFMGLRTSVKYHEFSKPS